MEINVKKFLNILDQTPENIAGPSLHLVRLSLNREKKIKEKIREDFFNSILVVAFMCFILSVREKFSFWPMILFGIYLIISLLVMWRIMTRFPKEIIIDDPEVSLRFGRLVSLVALPCCQNLYLGMDNIRPDVVSRLTNLANLIKAHEKNLEDPAVLDKAFVETLLYQSNLDFAQTFFLVKEFGIIGPNVKRGTFFKEKANSGQSGGSSGVEP